MSLIGMSLTLTWDTSQIRPLLNRGLERALFRTLSKAGGDAIRAARVASSRTVRFRKRMRTTKVNDGLVLRFPRSPQEIESLVWRVDVSGAMVPVSSFITKPFGQRIRGRTGRKEVSSGGIVAKINSAGPSRITGAFQQRLKSGHVGIFMRTGEKTGPKGGRQPFRELFTTRITDVFGDSGMVPAVHQRAQNVFASSFARLLPLEIAKLR